MSACGCGAVTLRKARDGAVRCAGCAHAARAARTAADNALRPTVAAWSPRRARALATATGIPFATLRARVQRKGLTLDEAVAMGPARRRAA